MADEARRLWEAFITAPENAHLLKRYAKSAKEPAPFFDSIGEDLASSNQAVREQAFWALVLAMPKLMSILYERETRQPGWRDVEGKDEKMINRGANIITDLHRRLVKKHRFTIDGMYDKDPRRYVNKSIRNRNIDEHRKRKREVQQDDNAPLESPHPTRSLEESVIENNAYEAWMSEFRRLLRSDDELEVFITTYVDRIPLAEALESNGIDPDSADVTRQQFSRARKHAVADRDALFTFLLSTEGIFLRRGKLPRFPKNSRLSELCAELVIPSVQPGAWLNGVEADGKNALAVRPLTRSYSGAPAHIYLVALHKEYIYDLILGEYRKIRLYDRSIGLLEPYYDVLTIDNQRCLKSVGKLIDLKSRELRQGRYLYRLLEDRLREVCRTELPGLNAALDEVGDDYGIWFISTSVPAPLQRHQWEFGESTKEHEGKIRKLYNGDLVDLGVVQVDEGRLVSLMFGRPSSVMRTPARPILSSLREI